MDHNERALLAVLDSTADQEVPTAARRAAERDLAAIRHGLRLLAVEATPSSRRRRYHRRWLAAAAGIIVLAAALVIIMPGLTHRNSPGTSTVPAPSVPLRERAAAAQRIVVGTVIRIDRGRLDSPVEGETGDRYILATVHVEQALKGPDGPVVAFSYDFGDKAITSEGSTRPWNIGDHILLFLVSDTGSISANLNPPHLQTASRYFVHGDRLDPPAFTLEDVRRAVR